MKLTQDQYLKLRDRFKDCPGILAGIDEAHREAGGTPLSQYASIFDSIFGAGSA